MSGRAREDWDAVVAEWAANPRFRLWRRHSDAVNTRLLRRWLTDGGVRRLLKTDLFDEAVAEGLYPVLAAAAEEVLGIDVSAGAAAAAGRRHRGLRAQAADVRGLPFDDASIDLVVSISTLDHFDTREDIDRALRELSRVLRPGGQLILTLDNLAQPLIWLRSVLPQRLMMRLGLVPYAVGKTLRPRQLHASCRAAGLEVRTMTAVLHCPRAVAVALTRVLESRASRRAQDRFLSALGGFERLERWPTRYLTGHFTAIRARKPAVPGGGADTRN